MSTTKLLIVRHGLAGTREKFKKKSKQPDSQRPLTAKGKREMKKTARSIKKIVSKVDVIATSPFVRAYETALILSKSYTGSKMTEMKELTPTTSPERTLQAIRKIKKTSTIGIVGHEPHLSRFLNFILTGATGSSFDIKKGGFALLEFANGIERNQAQLLCLIQPSQMKKIRRK